jgi:double-stranded uracil-DNA glycosylase
MKYSFLKLNGVRRVLNESQKRLESSWTELHLGLRRPTPAELRESTKRLVRDVITDGLDVLFCGINPGLYSSATGHHFARPGNRFWPALHKSGFTDELLTPFRERELLARGVGITNLISRATATADLLTLDEIVAGGRRLSAKVRRRRPKFAAILGVVAYRVAFDKSDAKLGLQKERIGSTRLWVLPNPSGLNAHYQLNDLAKLFAELRNAATTRR